MTIKKSKRQYVYERDEGICAYCNKFVKFEDYTIDHIVPKKVGGKTNDTNNMVVSCKKCNLDKDTKDFRLYCIIHTTNNKHLIKLLCGIMNLKKLYTRNKRDKIL